MSLDSQLRERAERELEHTMAHCLDILDRQGREIGITGKDLARMISGHKVDTLRAKIIKDRANAIGETLMDQLEDPE